MAGDKIYHINWADHSVHFMPRFKYFLENQKYVDVTLECDGHVIKAHRVVLAASSTFFENILSEKDNISLLGVKFTVLYSLMEFIYYGQTRVIGEELEPFFKLARFFQIKSLNDMSFEKLNSAFNLNKSKSECTQQENSKVAQTSSEKIRVPVRTHFTLDNASAYTSGGYRSIERIDQMRRKLDEKLKYLRENPILNATNDSVRKSQPREGLQIRVGDERRKRKVKTTSDFETVPVPKRRVFDENFWNTQRRNKGYKHDHCCYAKKAKKVKVRR